MCLENSTSSVTAVSLQLLVLHFSQTSNVHLCSIRNGKQRKRNATRGRVFSTKITSLSSHKLVCLSVGSECLAFN